MTRWGFQEARARFRSGDDYLDIFHVDHSATEDRFVAIGPIRRGVVLIVCTERGPTSTDGANRVVVAHLYTNEKTMMGISELAANDFARAIPARLRKRLILGHSESGANIAALRQFVGLTQLQFAQAMAISVHTLRNWRHGRRRPDRPAIAPLRIAVRHPRIVRESVESTA